MAFRWTPAVARFRLEFVVNVLQHPFCNDSLCNSPLVRDHFGTFLGSIESSHGFGCSRKQAKLPWTYHITPLRSFLAKISITVQKGKHNSLKRMTCRPMPFMISALCSDLQLRWF
jgi:hypothetical protein